MSGSEDPVIRTLFREALITNPPPEGNGGGGSSGGSGGGGGGNKAAPKVSAPGARGSLGDSGGDSLPPKAPQPQSSAALGKLARESLLQQRASFRIAPRDSWFKPRGDSVTGVTPGGALAEGDEGTGGTRGESEAEAGPEDADAQAEKWGEVDRDSDRWEDLVGRIQAELAASRGRGPLVVVPAATVGGSGVAAVAALHRSQQQQLLEHALKRQSGTGGRGNSLTSNTGGAVRSSSTGQDSKRPTETLLTARTGGR